MELKHPATYDIPELLKILNVDTLEQFVKNVVMYGKVQDPDIYDPLDYMGDCWEVLAEYFFKFHNGDHTLTYTANYEPNFGIDRGIDGYGVSTLDGKKCVLQHKFKANSTTYLTNNEDISNVVADATLNKNVIPNGKNIIIFTSCKGVHPNHAMAAAHCINFTDIKRRVNKNVVFWNDFRDIIERQNNDKEQS